MAERVDGPGTTRGNRNDDELSQANDFRLSDEDVERHDVVMHEPGHMEPPLDPESSTVFSNEDVERTATRSETADSSQTGLPPLETTTTGSEEFAPAGSDEVGRSSRPRHEEELPPETLNTARTLAGDDPLSAVQPTRFVGERSERGQDSPPPAAPAPQAATPSGTDPAPVDTTDPTPTSANLAATVSLQNIVAGLSETTDTSSSVKVADIVITDDGIGSNTLSLTGADATKFEIVDTGLGFELHLRAGTVLDHESAAAFDITVQVDDPTVGGTPDDSVSQTVNIGDVNDTGQVFVSGNSNNAAENVGDAATLYTASVTDADTTGEAITFSLVDNAGGLFEIDANTGQVTLAGGQSLDFETATSHDITIRSTDGTNSTDHTVTINVTDVNDNAQVFTSGAGASIAEDVNDSSVIYTATTTDVDTTGEAITYSLTDDAGGLFEINSATGEVTLTGGQALDFETATSHDITIRSSDGTNTSDHTVTINVTDVNESGASAISDTNVSVDGVNENSSVGSVVGITALATDSDTTDTISYSLSDNAGGLFAIDPNTGVVTVAGALDAETAQNQSIEVTATSTDGSTSTQTFNITVHDVDEFNISATSDNDGTANTVSESAVVGSALGITALASDADVTDTVTYSLSSNPGGFFAIDANTGVVTVANTLDYETDASHTIEVTSTSTDGSTSTQTFTVNVSDEDEADVGAISDTNATGNAVNENATVGTVVGVTAFASDADGTDAVTYSLSDDASGLFAIDANTGVVTVAGAIDRETAASYDIEVTATSDDGSTSTQTFTISVNDLDEFDVSAPTDTNAGANTVSETAANGTAVGITASASDGDATNSAVTYSIVDGSGDPVVGGPFIVDPNTGVVTIADNRQLDYETATSHTIHVKATSADGSDATQSFTVDLTDTDEADVGAISDTNGAGNAVNENASVGTVVGVTAFAADTDGTDTVSYSLSDDAGGLFAIDANTGVVTVAGAIDRETAASYDIEVTAASTDGSTSTQTFTISVNDLDEFDVSTPTDSNVAANSVAENAANGTAVGITAAAADGDATNSTVTYALVDGSGDPVVGGPFTVDANTGVVTVADNAQLDYETATSHTIYIKATSADGSDATQSFTVNLTDVNEAGVGAISDTNTDANGVAENSAVGTVIGVTALASDPDSSDTVTYSLSDDAGGLFAIDANTGIVTVAGALDAETAQNHSIEVTATSTDGSTSTQTFNIAVNDVDEFNISTTTDSDGTANAVSEAATVGTAVGITALASDADVTDTVTYSLSSNPGGFFAIDANTGVVTVANTLDYETDTSHVIEVTSTSDDGSTSTQTFTVNVADHDETDVGAISDTNAGGNAVDENSSVGTVVGVTAFASDADGTDTVSYSLSDDAGGLFAIDANTGVITVAGAIDRETAASYNVEVTATSTDGSTSTQTYTIGVNDLDEFDVSTPTDSNADANSVAENAANGTVVGVTASAADGDATNSTVTYALVDGSGDPVVGGPFAVDPNTGVVTVADSSQLDYETATSHTVYIKATSADGSDATQSFTINLTDTDEGAVGAVSDSNVAGNSVDESASVGTVVGITAVAADPDGSDTVTYTLSDDAGGLFAIDANTGVVTVAAGLDAETAQNHIIEVTATSTDGSTSTQTFNIGVDDVDEFDISATTDNDGTANAVSEAATVGTAVGVTALASDADVTDAVTYTLSSNPGGFFAIDANTGVVTVANALDYETDTSHTIEVTSTSDDGTTSTQTFTINVGDADESDVSAISDTNATGNAVDENSSVGTVVGVTAFAADADGTDTVSYSLSDDAGGLFAIDANTGVVTVAGTIDREAAASYDIEVTATSTDGSTSAQTYTIGVNDLDEFDVSTPTDSNVAANSVSEGAANGTAVGITAAASDGDATNNGVTYALVDGSGDPVVGGPFTVDANTGVVTVADNTQLDHETATSHTIFVKATSADGSDATQSFTVNLTDANEADVGAISDTNASGNAVNEDASVGTVVGITALAADPDSTDTVTYSLSDDAGGLFTIDANTGVVTVAAGLDAETAQNHSIEVTATSTDGSTSTQTFNIGVNDVDEFDISATNDNDGTANAVSEAATVGTAVGITALATDADITDTVSYSLSSNPGGFFAIDANTGVVTVANGLDYETDTSHVIEVTSTSADGSTSTQTFTINVGDEDEADVSAISDTNATGNAVDENSSVGTVVGVTAFASDADGTDSVAYSLSDDAGGLFTIDANTGVVTVAGAIDRETAASYDIEVTATSDDGSTSTQTFTVSVNDLDEFDVSTPTDANVAANSVSESAANGTAVGITASASDGDATNNGVTYALVDGSGDPVVGGPFTVDANTGVVTVADNSQLDYETATSHTIYVKASSADGSDATQSFTVNLTDADEADVGAISDTNVTSNAVDENSSVGTVVGITAQASDADGTDTVTYSLSDNAGGLFAIDTNTGVVTVAGAIDAETAQNHSIEVTATSTDGSTSTQTFNIAVNDVDEFDISATSDNDSTANAVSESATVGTAVGVTALATDADVTDTVSYSLSSNPGGFFAIDANTGVVTVANGLDYETDTSHVIEVTSTSADGSTSTQTFTINVGDEDEADVGAISDTNAAGNAVDENSSVGTVVGVTAFASDADGTDSVAYSLSDDAGGLFAIDANTGVVTVAGAIDRETAASYDIEVTATSDDGSTSTQTFTVSVNDLDEFDVSTPTDSNATANSVSESAANGTTVGITASASDGDATNNGVTYALVDGSGDPVVGGPFTVDANTGVVTVADNTQLDHETATSHTIFVKATSADGSDATQSFTVNLTDANEADVGAISDTNASGNAVNEDASVGTVVGITALAADPDSTDTVTYSLSDDSGGLFTIDANTGVVTVAAGLDAETAQNHSIEVTATSTDGSTSTQTFNIGVNDVDEFDISATSDNDGTANAVSESATVGTAVGVTALATDADVTDTVSYSLSSNPGGFFAIDANTGVVTVANGLDYETDTSHVIEVTSTSADGSTSTQTFTINVSDEDEADVGAISDTNATGNAVDENSSVGTVVGVTAFASDADGTDSVTYSLSDDASGLFAIDANTGVVTVAGAIDRETAASYDIEVTATSDDGSTSTQTFTVSVNDLDEFDVSTPTDSNATANSVSESAANGTTVGVTASASDGDATNSSVTYSMVDGSGDPVVGGPFTVDANTGVVTVADNSQLDYETATSHTIYVKATSADGSDATQSFTVNLTDADEADVGAISDTNVTSNAVDENSSVGTVVGITAQANDADGTDTVTYSLSDNAGGLFAIDANTGVVTVAGAIDAETAQNHSIEVTATSTDGSTSTQTFNIAVNDVDEFNVTATSDNDGTANSVSEAATVGTAVGVTALASDADVTDTVSYSLSSNPGGFFAIDANTGVVTVAGALDYETDTSHVIEVTSTSSDGSTTTETFTINVDDFDEADVGSITDTNATGNAVDENVAVGTAVGITASASDADGSDNVTYSLSDNAGGLFAIDANTGVVTVAGAIDRETAASYDIEVTATSDDTSTSTQTYTINVNDIDEFDVSTPTDSNAAANSIAENTANGTVVGITVSASDGDATNNGVTYSLVDSGGNPVVGGAFAVDSNTGVVTVADNTQLDYETATSQTIYVKATSADGSDATQSFAVDVTNVFDEAPTDIVFPETHAIAIVNSGFEADASGYGAITGWDTTGSQTGNWDPGTSHYGGEAPEGDKVGIIDNGGTVSQTLSENFTEGTSYSLSAMIGDEIGGGDPSGWEMRLYAGSQLLGSISHADFDPADGTFIDATLSLDSATLSDFSAFYGEALRIEFYDDGTSDNFHFDDVRLNATASNLVSEDASNGTVITAVQSVTDPEVGDTHTFALLDDAGGAFSIDANTGEITLADSSKIDYETATSHNVTVQVTDAGGNTYQEVVAINVADANEAPTDIAFTGNEDLAIGAAVGTTVATATGVDPDSGETFTYALTDDANGLFSIDASTGAISIAGGLGLDLTHQTGSDNPFNGIDIGSYSAPVLVDLDGDGDLDIMIGNGGSYGGDSEYYENTGSATNPSYSFAGENPFGLFDIGGESTPSFVDIDGDGDMDMFIGESNGTIKYFENTGNSTSPAFTQRTGGSNPFNGEDVGLDSTPTFVDIDNDGDMDAVVGDGDGQLNYYINTGTAAAPTFTAVTGATFGVSGTIDIGVDSSPTFVDADGDGDMDMFVGESDGVLNYFENTGTAANASFSATPSVNPFGTVDIGAESMPTFADVDGDGDMDLIVGESDGTLNFFENTASVIDGSSTTSHDITVQVTDSGGLTTSEDVTLQFGTSGIDTLTGDADTDILYGFGGDDTLSGAGGDDVIYGGDDTAHASTGTLDLNDTGETNEYARATNFQGFPSSAITVEMAFQAAPTTQSEFVLFSYAASGESNEFTLYQKSDGTLKVYVAGSSADLSISTDLTDGDPHTISVTWNESSGSYQVYIDGSLEASTNISQGVGGLYGNGTFMLGQEQDSLGGSFDSSQIFSGDIDFVRVFNDVRTSQEISDNYNSQLANPGSESGLVTNWQMDADMSSGTQVDDLAGNNDLTLVNTTDIVAGTGTTGGDTISGGDGNDSLYGGGGTDDLDGDAGDDLLVGGLGADNLDGGAGNDTLYGDNETTSTARTYSPSNAVFSYATGSNLGDGASGGTNHRADVASSQVSNLVLTLPTGDTTLGAGETIGFSFIDENGNTITVSSALIQQTAFATTGANETGIMSAQGQDQDGNDVAILFKMNNNDGSAPSAISAGGSFYDNDTDPNALNGTDIELPESALDPLGGDDTLDGGDGNDTLIGGVGADSLDGGAGTDVADYSTSASAVTVNLGTGTGTGGDAQGDTLTNIENVTGSDYNDTLTGDSGANTLTGGDGNDTLYGGDGSDLFVFWEGDGADSVYGGQGASWTDTIELHDSSGGANLGTYGVDWTVNLTEGSITSQDSDSLTLSDDADGTITLQDGSSINFYDIERVEF